jgi:hypothetical protein
VRAYYDGENVFMTPSCVIANLTNMNLEYNYFAGTQKPSTILMKYLVRGFGVFLNQTELQDFIGNYNETNIPNPNLLKMKQLNDPIFKSDKPQSCEYITNGSVEVNKFNTNGDVIPFKSSFCEKYWSETNERLKFTKQQTTMKSYVN